MLKQPISIRDNSAILTGVLLAFNLPSSVPVWLVILGSLFAIGVAKMSYGGLGKNIFNPALAGRVFLLISFPALMTTFPLNNMVETPPTDVISSATLQAEVVPEVYPVETNMLSMDAVSGATPLGQIRGGLAKGKTMDEVLENFSIKDLLYGNRGGSYGEIASLALLLGFFYMLYKKIITWHIPVYIIGSMALFSGSLWLVDPTQYLNPLYHILTGGALLGAIFMATDYVTSPMTKKGMLIYSIGIGVITILVRTWGGYPEGLSFAILLMNATTPLLNKIKPRLFGEKK